MITHTAVVPWIRATCFGLGLILAVGGAYLFLCGVGLAAGVAFVPGILDLLVGILLIAVASSLFRARRLLSAPIATSPNQAPEPTAGSVSRRGDL
jgi:hypothetical protein